jgi:hypothetical protein
VVDQTVFGSGVLGLEGAEESLLSTQDLDGGSRVLCEVKQTSSMGNETGSNELSHQNSEIGSNRLHAVLQILEELISVLAHLHHLGAKITNVEHVLLADLWQLGENEFGGRRGRRTSVPIEILAASCT